jgi:hypothetical protein
MSFLLCEKLENVNNQKDKFKVFPKSKFEKESNVFPGNNVVVLDAGVKSHYKILFTGKKYKIISGIEVRIR